MIADAECPHRSPQGDPYVAPSPCGWLANERAFECVDERINEIRIIIGS